MTEPAQLTLDGGEVDHPPHVSPTAPWSDAQHDILLALASRHLLRSAEAGVIVHGARRQRLNRGECVVHRGGFDTWPEYPRGGRFVGCCQYAATDGLAAMRRLEARGVVERVGVGVWQLRPEPAHVEPVSCAVKFPPAESGHRPVRQPDVATSLGARDGAGREEST